MSQAAPAGASWAGRASAGASLPIDQFHIVKAGATAASINAALAAGKNLLFTPGVYHLDQTLRVTRPNMVVLGLGLAILVPAHRHPGSESVATLRIRTQNSDHGG